MAILTNFAALVEQHHGMVFSIAYRSLGSREAAEDLTQDVFLSLHQHLDSLESDDHVRHWLRRAAATKSIDELRRRSYRRGPSLEEVAEPSRAAHEPDPLLSAHLRQSVASLPPLARVLTVMRFQQELEPREIAAQLNIPVATVKSRLHRTLKLLRGKLDRRAAARKAV
jgi:RNA polymerase sigma-70 factor (ECF subfamily)